MTFKVGDWVRLVGSGWDSNFPEQGKTFKVFDIDKHGWAVIDQGWMVSSDPEEAYYGEVVVSNFQFDVEQVVEEVRSTLLAKNKAYGNSALEPVRVFSTSDPVEQLRVRIDDKLSRLKSSADDNEDTVLDLMGYLVLLRIATRKQDDNGTD